MVGAAAFVGFVGYAAVKGAYLSTTFSELVVERNVIYLVPVVLAATAAVLSRSVATLPGLAAGLVVALLLVFNAEFRLDQYPYFEAPSLAIGALTNRNFSWDHIDVRNALIAAAIVSFVILVLRSRVRSQAIGLGIAVVSLCVVASWALTTEVYAARGLNLFAEQLHASTPQPVDWVDRATGGRADALPRAAHQRREPDLAARVLEPLDRQDLEPRRDRAVADALARPRRAGRHDRPEPDVEWVVTGNGVEVVGERVGEPYGGMTLFHVTPPVRFRYAQNGVSTDGWMSEHATYSQYAPDEGATRGFARIALSRQGACGANIPTANVVVRVGTVVVEKNQPALGRVNTVVRRSLRPCELEIVVVPATVPFHVDVTASPTFVPRRARPVQRRRSEARRQIGFSVRAAARVAEPAQRRTKSRSGCFRRNRNIPRRCQSVCRLRKRLSITAA